MKPWNQAAWKQNTYRSNVRQIHGPVGGDWPGKTEMLAKARQEHTARQDAQDAAHGFTKRVSDDCRPVPQPIDVPQGWAVAETSVEQDASPSLTLAQVAKLPVGTKVVVDCGDETKPTGTVLILDADWTSDYVPSVRLFEEFGAMWTITLGCSHHLTFKVVR